MTVVTVSLEQFPVLVFRNDGIAELPQHESRHLSVCAAPPEHQLNDLLP